MTSEEMDHEELTKETKRLCQRYIDEVVLPLSLCPWAAPAIQSGRVQMSVITDKFSGQPSHVRAARCVREALLQVRDESVELVLVLLPRCSYSRLEMDDLLREIRQDGPGHTPSESELSFALAAFHPDAEPITTCPERFIPYLRRTPDPMIQAVRTSTLTKIDPTRGAGTAYFDMETMDLAKLDATPPVPLRRRIAEANLKTVLSSGLHVISERLDSIWEDREATHARLRGRVS